MRVEVAFALPDRQFLESIELAEGATVDDAIERSGLVRSFPGLEFDGQQAGVWGRPVSRSYVLSDGDRVELYRSLEMDPREARRLKAGV
jgi:putative ubiquitin-RnfH superfamily antitoxin RatB of RatAB toxin-antitoxin module